VRRRPRRRALSFLAFGLAALPLQACSGRSGATPSPAFSPLPIVIVTTPPSTSGPYVVVAVDNHFHDIHPSDPPSIASRRPFVVKNEGHNLHNFTVVGTLISIDIPPGHQFRWAHIGDHLRPGFYQVFCKYHAYLGMTGNFYVTK
jgi:hypothetical protein